MKTTNTVIVTTAAAASAAILLVILTYRHGKRRGRIEAQAHYNTSPICDGSTDVSTSPQTTTSSCMIQTNDRPSTLSQSNKTKQKSISSDAIEMLQVYPIGTLRSIYRLCVGTPRQVRYLVYSTYGFFRSLAFRLTQHQPCLFREC